MMDNNYDDIGEEEEDILNLNLADHELDAMHHSLNISNLRRDGERSSNRGPCRCGYRHWVDGKEYDFVFKWANFDGLLGFNLGDNAYIAATDFVMRHDVNKDSLNHRNSVNMIVNTILKHIDQFEPVKIDKPKPESTFDPYKPTLHVPAINTTRYNKVTQKFEKTTYAIDELTPEQREEIRKKEEYKKKIKQDKEVDEKAKSEITDLIRRDMLEKKKEEEYKKSLRSSFETSPPQPNPYAVTTPTLKGGQLVWEESSEPTLKERVKAASIRTLRHQDDSSNSSDDEDSDNPYDEENPEKEMWTLPMLLKSCQRDGYKATEEKLLKSGFSENDCKKYLEIAKAALERHNIDPDSLFSHMHDHDHHHHHHHHHPHENIKKKDTTAFAGKGFTLGSFN